MPLSLYILTILAGLIIHAFIVIPILLITIGKYSPIKLAKEITPALATVFSTASSAAALPLTIDCLIKKTGVPNKIVSFLIPLGTTINMNGTALYQGVSVVFLAQLYGIKLGLSHYLIIILTATLAAIAAAGIPSSGLFTMILILNVLNIPVEGIVLILGVDRILDMFRSTTNLWGNANGAVIMARLDNGSTNSSE